MTDYFDTLKTLQELYSDAATFAAAFPDIDEATATAIYQGFHWRQVCDNDRFPDYLISMWNRVGQQYEDLLHTQLTRIDPMVTKYLERQLTHGGGDTTTTTGKTTYNSTLQKDKNTTSELSHGHEIVTDYGSTDTTTHNTTDSTEYGKTETTTLNTNTKVSYESSDTTTHDTTDQTNYGKQHDLSHGENIAHTGTDTETTKNNQTRNDHTSATIAKRTTTTENNAKTAAANDSRSLSASLPRVDSYTANGIPAPVVVETGVTDTDDSTVSGMVAGAFDWRNADSQAESAGASHSKSHGSGSTSVIVDKPDESDVTTAYSGAADQRQTTYNTADNHTGTDTEKDTGSDSLVKTGTDKINYDGSDTTTRGGSDEVKTTGTDSVTKTGTESLSKTGQDVQTNRGTDTTKNTGGDTDTHTGDDSTEGKVKTELGSYDRERYTGHDGNPAELLQKAAQYIKGTGAFSWLYRHIDTLFFSLYEF